MEKSIENTRVAGVKNHPNKKLFDDEIHYKWKKSTLDGILDKVLNSVMAKYQTLIDETEAEKKRLEQKILFYDKLYAKMAPIFIKCMEEQKV